MFVISLGFALLFLSAYLTEGILLFELFLSFLPFFLVLNFIFIALTGVTVFLAARTQPFSRYQLITGVLALTLLITTFSTGLLKVYAYANPFTHPVQDVQTSSSSLKIGFQNKLYSNKDYNLIQNVVRHHQLDIIGFGEFLATDFEELKKLLPDYPYAYHTNAYCAQGYECELGVYSKYSWETVQEHKLPSGDIALEVIFTHNEQTISLFVTHPHAPFSQKNVTTRNKQLKSLSGLVQSSTTQHTAIMGDLNVTPWSPSYTDFLNSLEKLRDTAQGNLGLKTWGIGSIQLLHLDYIFVTKDTKSSHLHIENTYGSDHNLVWTELYF